MKGKTKQASVLEQGTTAPPEHSNATVKKLAFLLAAIAFLVYANTLKNDFAYDDFLVIKENTFVTQGFQGIPHILTTPYHKGFNAAATELYRPLALVVFAAVYQVFGAAPFVFHLLNIAAFACCVAALFLFLHKLFRRTKPVAAFTAALLFALHPIHTEVVANCKSLDELLCFFFAFASLNTFMAYTDTGRKSALFTGTVLYLLAFLAKETAVTFLVLIPFIFFVHTPHRQRTKAIIIGILAAAGIAFAARYIALGSYNTSISGIGFVDNPLADKTLSAASRLATAILIMGKYLLLLLSPWPLLSDYSYSSIPFATFATPAVLGSLAVYIALAVICIIRLRKAVTDFYAFAILFFLITLSLFSNVLFLVGVNMAERFLFFPSAGFCIVVALLIDKWAKQPAGIRALLGPKPLLVLAPLCIAYTALSINRNSHWKDNLTLFSADVRQSPQSCRLNFLLGNELVLAGQATEAIPYLQQAADIYPDYAAAHFELGKALYGLRNYPAAAIHAQKAAQLLPADVNAANSLGIIYLALQQYNEAISIFRNILRQEPANVPAHFNIGACYANVGNYEMALTHLKATIALSPRYAEYAPYEYVMRIYNKMGNIDSVAVYAAKLQKEKGR